jgi:hypothetical protein
MLLNSLLTLNQPENQVLFCMPKFEIKCYEEIKINDKEMYLFHLQQHTYPEQFKRIIGVEENKEQSAISI